MGTTPRVSISYPESSDLLSSLPAQLKDMAEDVEREIPRGMVAYKDRVTNSTASTGTVDAGLEVTCVLWSNRRYIVQLDGQVGSTVNGDVARVLVLRNGAAFGNSGSVYLPLSATQVSCAVSLHVVGIAGFDWDTTTFKVQHQRQSGTGSIQVRADAGNPMTLVVLDLGPV